MKKQNNLPEVVAPGMNGGLCVVRYHSSGVRFVVAFKICNKLSGCYGNVIEHKAKVSWVHLDEFKIVVLKL